MEHSGFPRVNVSRFGQKFVGRVANPDDLLLFYKQKVLTTRSRTPGINAKDLDLSSLHAKREVDEAPPIHDIVAQLIARTPLSVLNEDGLADAIEDFVEKKNLESISEFIKRDLKQMQQGMRGEKEVMGKGGGLSPEEIEKEVKRRHDEQRDRKGGKKRGGRAKKEGKEGEEERDVLEGLDVGQLSLLGIQRDGGGRDGGGDDDEGYGDEEEKEEKKGGRGRGGSARGRGGAKGRGRGAKAAPASRQKSKVEYEEAQEKQSEANDWDEEESGGGRGGRGGRRDDFDDEGEEEWGAPQGTPSPRAKSGGRVLPPAEEEMDEEVPPPKRSRVKAEPPSVALGSRNRAGELNFLTGGGARKRAPAAAAAPARQGGAGRGRGRGGVSASNVVDLSEDIDLE